MKPKYELKIEPETSRPLTTAPYDRLKKRDIKNNCVSTQASLTIWLSPTDPHKHAKAEIA